MNRLMLIALVSVFVLSGFTGVAASGQDPVTLKFAEIHDADYSTTIGDFEIAKLVKERTNGRVTIEVYHSMKLGDEAAVIKNVQEGEIDFPGARFAPAWICPQSGYARSALAQPRAGARRITAS